MLLFFFCEMELHCVCILKNGDLLVNIPGMIHLWLQCKKKNWPNWHDFPICLTWLHSSIEPYSFHDPIDTNVQSAWNDSSSTSGPIPLHYPTDTNRPVSSHDPNGWHKWFDPNSSNDTTVSFGLTGPNHTNVSFVTQLSHLAQPASITIASFGPTSSNDKTV